MRVLRQELFKILSRRFILFILAALVVLNAAVLYYSEQSRVFGVSSAQAERFEKDLSGLTNEQALGNLQTAYDELTKLQDVQMAITSVQPFSPSRYTPQEVSRLTDKLKTGGYLTYTSSLYSEMLLYKGKLDEIRAVGGYEAYKQGIMDNAEKMTSISLFADPGSFTYRNAEQTAHDYSVMNLPSLQFGNSHGVAAATQGVFTDVFALVFLLLCVVSLLTQEKENKTLDLLKSMPNGRGTLAASKMGAVFICCLAAVVLFYGADYFMAGVMYGFGDLSRPLQSVLGFLGSTWQISVGSYLFYYLLCKLLTYMLWSIILFTVCIVARKSVQVYATAAIIVGVSCGLYYTIDAVSPFCLLKYINLFFFLNTSKLFSDYLNLNLCGFPVSFVPIFFTVAALGIALLFVINIRVFSKQKIVQFKRKSIFGFENRRKIRGSSCLFQHENYKAFIASGALLILVLAAAFQIADFRVNTNTFMDINDAFYKRYMTQLEGPVTPNTDAFIKNEQKRFEDISKELMQRSSPVIDSKTIELSNQLAAQQAFNQVVERYNYLKTLQQETGKRGNMIYDKGHQLLTATQSNRSDATMALFCVVLLVASTVYIFTIEYQSGAIDIIRTTPYGRKKTFTIKQSICLIIALLCFLIVYLPEYLRVFLSYGTAGITAPVCSLPQFSGMPQGITLVGYYGLINLIRLVGLFVCVNIIIFISKLAKSYIIAALISTTVIGFPLVFSLLKLSFFDCLFLDPVLLSNQLFKNTGTAENLVSWGFFISSIVFGGLMQRKYLRSVKIM